MRKLIVRVIVDIIRIHLKELSGRYWTLDGREG